MAAADVGNLPKVGAGSGGDSEVVGKGPHGETLYNAEWAREPTDAELRGYLPHNLHDGWGLIMCKTIPGNRVEDCIELGQDPPGSHLASAIGRRRGSSGCVRRARTGDRWSANGSGSGSTTHSAAPADLPLRLLLRSRGRFFAQQVLADADRPGRAIGKLGPCRGGTLATLAHMVERCRVRLVPSLRGSGEVEFKVCGRTHAAYSASGASSSAAAGASPVASSADFRFTAAILPRRSCSRS